MTDPDPDPDHARAAEPEGGDPAALADEIDAMRRGATTGAESTPINVARLDAWANTARRLRCSHAPSVAAPPREDERPRASVAPEGEDAFQASKRLYNEAALPLVTDLDDLASMVWNLATIEPLVDRLVRARGVSTSLRALARARAQAVDEPAEEPFPWQAASGTVRDPERAT